MPTSSSNAADQADITASSQSDADPSGFPADYVALDLETTGFYPTTCAITEIGAVRVRGGHIVDRFQHLVNPLQPIPHQVTALTGITDEMVSGYDPIDEVLPTFTAWLTASPQTDAQDEVPEPIIGHNIGFDLRFLDANALRVTGCHFACVDYDTMQISRMLFPGQRGHKLVDLIRRFDIADNEEHRALSDAIQTQQCFEWMHRYIVDSLCGAEDPAARRRKLSWKTQTAKTTAEIMHRQLVLH